MTARPTRGTVEPRTVLVLLVVVLLAAVVLSVTVPDSPYDPNVAVDRGPFAPERPAELNRTTATAYAVAYEKRVLRNDILSSRGFSLDMHDGVQTQCVAAGVQRRLNGQNGGFRVHLQCHGDVVDVNRPIQPSGFGYAATYIVATTETRRIGVDGYPYGSDDENLTSPIPDDGNSSPRGTASQMVASYSAQSGFSRGGLKISTPRTTSSPRFSAP